MKPACRVARRSDYTFDPAVPIADARRLVVAEHYARGASNTATDIHGLRDPRGLLVGVAWWLPTTRVAAESVAGEQWRTVVGLSRLVVRSGEPQNTASILLGRSIRHLRRCGRWTHLVTYADESQGHLGTIYRATNWTYVGRTGPYPRWIDPSTGQQVAIKATRSRTKQEMENLGYVQDGSWHKHKFVMKL